MRYIYCHPLFDERKCSHRFSYQLCESFKSASLILERFDYLGTGEADGDFKDVTMETLRGDIDRKISCNKASLIGVRFGATLALDYCRRHANRINKLVLIEPILDGAAYVNHLYRKQHLKDIMTGCLNLGQEDGFRNIEGYKTNLNFIEQIEELSLFKVAENCSAKKLLCIVQISNHCNKKPHLTFFVESLENTGCEVKLENINLPAFWERIADSDYTNLTKMILEWCGD